jgi:hypothetical protein
MDELRATLSAEGNLAMDWDFEGEEFDEESKLRAETRKIVELPERPIKPRWSRDGHAPPGLSRPPTTPLESTTSWSVASGATRPLRTAWSSSLSPTTFAEALR